MDISDRQVALLSSKQGFGTQAPSITPASLWAQRPMLNPLYLSAVHIYVYIYGLKNTCLQLRMPGGG